MQSIKGRELPRRDVIQTLAKSIRAHPLTVATAPAGYGKTTVAQKLLGHNRENTFFHSVPGGTVDSIDWWDSLCASLEKQGMEAARHLRRMGFPQNSSMTQRIIDVIKNISPPFTLILDDCQNIADAAVDGFLETLVRAEPSEHRFALFSRARPRMNLDDLAAKGLAVVFDQHLLEFSEAEAARFFFLNGVADKTAAGRAWRYSEGWAAALWLSLQRVKGEEDLPSSMDIDSLLDKAVFTPYSLADQDLLMRLSVMDSVTVAEAKSIVGGSDMRAWLSGMDEGNALIRLDANTGRYVFHSIFRDFLEKKLAARDDLNVPDLYRRAAECHIRRRELIQAFRLLAKAGRDKDMVRVLELILHYNGENARGVSFGVIRAIVETIPWRLRMEQPLGYLAYVWYCFEDGFDPRTLAMFEEMDKRFRCSKDIPPFLKRRLAGETEFMRGWLYMYDDRWGTLRHYKNACELLDGPSVIRYDRMCWNFCCPHFMSIIMTRELRARVENNGILEQIHPLLHKLTAGVTEGIALIPRIEDHLECGDFAVAERMLDDIELLLDSSWNMTSTILSRFSKARLMSASGDPEGGLAVLTAMIPEVEATDSNDFIQCLELAIGYACVNVGRPEAAPKWLQDCDIFGPPYGDTQLQCFMATVCGKLLLEKGDFDGLASFLSSSPDIFGPVDLTFSAIHAAVFKAVLAWRRHDEENAVASLREAVEISRPDGFVLSLAEYGNHILPMLHRLEDKAPDDAHLEKVIAFAEKFVHTQLRQEKRNANILSAREFETMRHVAKGRATSDIAKKMDVSASTVKTHLASAYRKLNAKNRAQAAYRFQLDYVKQPGKNAPADNADEPQRHGTREKTAPTAQAFADADPDRFIWQIGEEVADEFPEIRRQTSATENRMMADRLAERGELANAFRFYLRAGRNADLACALDLFSYPGGGEMTASHYDDACEAVDSFAWPVRMMRPLSYLAFLWWRFRLSREHPSGLLLDEAEHYFSKIGTPASGLRRRLAGEMALLRGMIRAHDPEALWSCRDAALKTLRGPSKLPTRQTSWTFGNPLFSFAAVREAGDFSGLAERVTAASDTLSALTGGNFTSMNAAFRMERHLERGELIEAGDFLPELARRGEEDMQAAIIAAFAEARMHLAKGRADDAIDLLERIRPGIEGLGSHEHSESLDLALGYVNAQLGRIDAIAPWLRAEKAASAAHAAAARRPFALVVYGKALAASGDFRKLDSVARTMPMRFGRYKSLLGGIHAKALEAIAARRLRSDDDALTHLREALELSRPDGLAFSLAEYGALLLPLLRRLRREYPDDAHVGRVTLLADRVHRNAATGGDKPAKPKALTRREREVMQLVVQGKSNSAIAEALGVSGSSIQKLLSGVYAKMKVVNRAEAARAFNLKSDSIFLEK